MPPQGGEGPAVIQSLFPNLQERRAATSRRRVGPRRAVESDMGGPSVAQSPPPAGPFAGVALEQSIDRVLDYSIPPRLQPSLRAGQRVRVPLGRNNRPTFGYVISVHEKTAYPKIKPLLEITDERVLVPPTLMDLARWMSRYYCTPLGAVLEAVIPSAVKKKVGVGYLQMVRLVPGREQAQAILEKTKAPKRRAIL